MFKVRKKETDAIQVKNLYNKPDYTKRVQNFKQTFDFLLLMQTSRPYKAAITSWHFVEKYSFEGKNGQVNSVIPYKHLCFVTEDSEGMGKGVKVDENINVVPLKDDLKNQIKTWFTKDREI